MNNQFTYSTRTGNKMRTYVKVAIWIFIIVAAIGVVAIGQSQPDGFPSDGNAASFGFKLDPN